MDIENLNIDVDETFAHLDSAPIVEAVIHWQARPEKMLDANELDEFLTNELDDYPQRQHQQKFEVEHKGNPEGSSLNIQAPSWHGVRCEKPDGLDIAQFTRSGLVYSRLKPYDDWDLFAAEAKRLWGLYRKLAEPPEIGRIGVRFINLIAPIDPEAIGEWLVAPPAGVGSLQLPLADSMHQRCFCIPGHPYRLNVIQVIQPAEPHQTHHSKLILDLDVFTTKPIDCDETSVDKHLRNMRWIKNTAFFSLLTENAVSRFRG